MKKIDPWAEWLFTYRFGGDEKQRLIAIRKIRKICSKVISNAKLSPDNVIVDVGCGEGVIGFSALTLRRLKTPDSQATHAATRYVNA